jgi:ribosomal protein L14E/L6E/L27E
MDNFPVGAVVQSRCGRDRFRCYVVCGTADSREMALVKLTDGTVRSVDKPKLKNAKHLRLLGFDSDVDVTNAESVRHSIDSFDPIKKDTAKK